MTKEELQKMSLYQLRILGRELGVKGVTKHVKAVLIEKILEVYSGKVEPTFTKRGRPPFKVQLFVDNIDEYFNKMRKLEEILSKTNKEIAELFSNKE